MTNIIITFLVALSGAIFFTNIIFSFEEKVKSKPIRGNLLAFMFWSGLFCHGINVEKFFDPTAILYSLPAQIITYLLYFKFKNPIFTNQKHSMFNYILIFAGVVLLFAFVSYVSASLNHDLKHLMTS